jgi:RNase H-like domain found in reverse transcriptase
MINYYRDMWRMLKRSHLILLLVGLTSKSVPFTWTEQCQKSFDDIKKIVAQEVLLNYPNFGIPFDIYTDASKKQLGAVIMQLLGPLHFINAHETQHCVITQLENKNCYQLLKQSNNIKTSF